MHPLDHFLSAWPGRPRAEILGTLPNATEVIHEDARAVMVRDHQSIMSVMPNRSNQRPEVLIIEFDGVGEVQFAELRRSFAKTRAGEGWIARLEGRLIEAGLIEIGGLLDKPVMRSTVHDGHLAHWRAWIVNDACVLTFAGWRVSGSDFPVTATLSMSASPWRPGFGPQPQMASYPHRSDEWAGWERSRLRNPDFTEPTMDEVLTAIRIILAEDINTNGELSA